MTGLTFAHLVNEALVPAVRESGFVLGSVQAGGKLYGADFVSDDYELQVSFEPGESYFYVMLISRRDRGLEAIDDPTRTPRLADLNTKYMPLVSNEERHANEEFFASIVADDSEERQLLKIAKELRLVLPRHLASSR